MLRSPHVMKIVYVTFPLILWLFPNIEAWHLLYLVKIGHDHITFHLCFIIMNLCPNLVCLAFKSKWSMPLLKFMIHFIKIVSWMLSKKYWKYKNELDLKIIKGSKKTSFVIFPKSIQLLASNQWQKVLGLCKFNWNLHDIYMRIQSKFTLWENKGFNLQVHLQLDFLIIMTTCNSRYLYNTSGIGQVVIFAQDIPHHIWKCIFIKNMCNFVQLNTIMLQLGCPCRFQMQNICEWTKWLCGFHSSIDEWNLLVSIKTTLQLMHFWKIVLQLMNFANSIMLQLKFN